MEQSRMQLS